MSRLSGDAWGSLRISLTNRTLFDLQSSFARRGVGSAAVCRVPYAVVASCGRKGSVVAQAVQVEAPAVYGQDRVEHVRDNVSGFGVLRELDFPPANVLASLALHTELPAKNSAITPC